VLEGGLREYGRDWSRAEKQTQKRDASQEPWHEGDHPVAREKRRGSFRWPRSARKKIRGPSCGKVDRLEMI
jgi:hypothetical protein